MALQLPPLSWSVFCYLLAGEVGKASLLLCPCSWAKLTQASLLSMLCGPRNPLCWGRRRRARFAIKPPPHTHTPSLALSLALKEWVIPFTPLPSPTPPIARKCELGPQRWPPLGRRSPHMASWERFCYEGLSGS